MGHTYLSTEGIVLRTFPYRDYDQIVTLFTANAGLIKVMCYGSRSQKSKWRSLCVPLTLLEIVYREKSGEIFECRDMSLIDSHNALKQHYSHLETACDLLCALNMSQMLGKEAPELYALLIYFLKKIPLIHDPLILSLSFRLKLLKHEGLLTCPFICHHCLQPLFQEAYFNGEEWQCAHDQSISSLHLAEQELQTVYQLVSSQKYGNLNSVTLPMTLKVKVEHFFQAYWKNR
jgi:DNA repair protein RecO (recombination protein O)